MREFNREDTLNAKKNFTGLNRRPCLPVIS